MAKTKTRAEDKQEMTYIFEMLVDELRARGILPKTSKGATDNSLMMYFTVQGEKRWVLMWAAMDGDVPSVSVSAGGWRVAESVKSRLPVVVVSSPSHHCSTNDPTVAAFCVERIYAMRDP